MNGPDVESVCSCNVVPKQFKNMNADSRYALLTINKSKRSIVKSTGIVVKSKMSIEGVLRKGWFKPMCRKARRKEGYHRKSKRRAQ